MKNTQFESAIAEITDVPTGDFKHPFLTKIKFIFADNHGNGNNQGIEEEDFDEIAKSSIHMPIKMRFSYSGVGGHEHSTPIGHIVSMTKEIDGEHAQLVGEAVLYSEEYPEEVGFLKETFAEGKAPGISWELAYVDSVVKNGIEWLKQVVTRAATFVKTPAYESRTPLLAIAEELYSDDDFMRELGEIITHIEQFANKWNVQYMDEDEEDAPREVMSEIRTLYNALSNEATAETFTPPAGVRSAAKRALKWIEEGKAGRNFTAVGRKRASDLARGASVSVSTIRRMNSFFARHAVDKKATGFSAGEEGYPSPGRVAWDAWGGDAGASWAASIVKRLESKAEEVVEHDETVNITGGINVEELEKAMADLKAAEASIEELTAKLNEAASTIEALSVENQAFKRDAIIKARTARVVEAGIKLDTDEEKLAKKQELWLSMSEEIFDAYVSDLASVAEAASAAITSSAIASMHGDMPRLAVAESDMTITDLKAGLRKASRGDLAEL